MPGLVGCVLYPVMDQKGRRAMGLKWPWPHSAVEVENPGLRLDGSKRGRGPSKHLPSVNKNRQHS